MESYRYGNKKIRVGSVADKVITVANKVEAEPYATVTFMGFMAGMIGTFCFVINSVYPIV